MAVKRKKILELYDYGDGLSIRKISELLGSSRNTVRKVIDKAGELGITKYELTVVAADVIDSYSEFKRLDFETQEDLDEWWLSTWGKSDVSRACELSGITSIKAFVTCSYGPWNGHERTIVYAIEGIK